MVLIVEGPCCGGTHRAGSGKPSRLLRRQEPSVTRCMPPSRNGTRHGHPDRRPMARLARPRLVAREAAEAARRGARLGLRVARVEGGEGGIVWLVLHLVVASNIDGRHRRQQRLKQPRPAVPSPAQRKRRAWDNMAVRMRGAGMQGACRHVRACSRCAAAAGFPRRQVRRSQLLGGGRGGEGPGVGGVV